MRRADRHSEQIDPGGGNEVDGLSRIGPCARVVDADFNAEGNAMTKRNLYRGALASMAALALGLTACGGSGTSPSTTDSAGSASAPAPTSGGGAVEIAYMHRLPDGEGMTKVNEIVKEWNDANPDIKVTATKFDGKAAEMITKLENDVKANAAPCLAQIGYAEVPSMYTKGLLMDVSSQASAYTGNYAAGAVGLMTVGDAVVGLPQDTGPLVYYYNKAEFDRLGIAVPTTSEELAAAAKTAAAQGKYVLAFQPDEAQYWLSAQAAAAGATWYSAENDQWKVTVTSPETEKVAAFWQDLLDNKAALVQPRWEDGFKNALNDQSLIGTIGAAWEAPLLAGDMEDTANVGQWAVAQLPAFGATAMSGPDGGSGVAVMKGCEAPAEAMKFNDWFNTQIDALTSQGLVVAAKGTAATPDDVKAFYGGQEVFAELGKANEAMNPDFPYMPTWPAIGNAMTTAAAAAGSGTGPVLAIFEAAQAESVKSLKDAGLPVAE